MFFAGCSAADSFQISARSTEFDDERLSRLKSIATIIAAIFAAALPMCAGTAALGQTADGAALMRAAERGDTAAIRRVIAAGVPPDASDSAKRTPLLAAF